MHRDQAEQFHVAPQGFLGQLAARRAADREHPQTGGGQVLGFGVVVAAGEGEDPFDRALDVDHVVGVPGRHEHPFRAERQDVHAFRHVGVVQAGLARGHEVNTNATNPPSTPTASTTTRPVARTRGTPCRVSQNAAGRSNADSSTAMDSGMTTTASRPST